MNHKLYKIKTKQKYNKRFPSKKKKWKQLKVSTETQRQTVTPNKDIVGEEREELSKQNRGGGKLSCYTPCRRLGLTTWV